MGSETVTMAVLGSPRVSLREEKFLLFSGSLPSDSILQVNGRWLLDNESTVQEGLRFIFYEPQPMVFLPLGYTVWLGKNACVKSVERRKVQGALPQTDSSLSLWVILLCHVMGTLIFKVRCIEN